MTELEMLPGMPGPPAPRYSERDLLDALHRRYSAVSPGNGPRYVIAEHVRSHAGFDARRTADLIAVDTWPSSGFQVHGHEVKVSRSDWLRELKDPDKAAEFVPYTHRWWVVVPDCSIVREDELPAGWGLMALRGRWLRSIVTAPRREARPLTASRSAALLRAVQATARRRSE